MYLHNLNNLTILLNWTRWSKLWNPPISTLLIKNLQVSEIIYTIIEISKWDLFYKNQYKQWQFLKFPALLYRWWKTFVTSVENWPILSTFSSVVCSLKERFVVYSLCSEWYWNRKCVAGMLDYLISSLKI